MLGDGARGCWGGPIHAVVVAEPKRRRRRAPWGKANGKACGHCPALARLAFGHLRQAAAGLGSAACTEPSSSSSWLQLLPAPCKAGRCLSPILALLSGRGWMGTVPSSIQASPRYPSLGVKVLPAALGRSGSFSKEHFRAISPWIWVTVLVKGDAAPCSRRGALARELPPTPGTWAAQTRGGGGGSWGDATNLHGTAGPTSPGHLHLPPDLPMSRDLPAAGARGLRGGRGRSLLALGREDEPGRRTWKHQKYGAKLHPLPFFWGWIWLVPGASAPCILEQFQPIRRRLMISVSLKTNQSGALTGWALRSWGIGFSLGKKSTNVDEQTTSSFASRYLRRRRKRLCKILFGDNS